jgi:hypothetical protein
VGWGPRSKTIYISKMHWYKEDGKLGWLAVRLNVCFQEFLTTQTSSKTDQPLPGTCGSCL